MKITSVIIHELDKEPGITSANLKLFNTTVDSTNDKVVKLIKELNNRYKNRNEAYSKFNKKDSTKFHAGFNEYYDNQTKKEFIKFTKESSRDLKLRIESNAPAKGGYLVFAQYEYIRNYLGVFLVRNTVGLSLKENTEQFDLNDVQHIDFENLAMACRINLDAYRKRDIRYLSFINKKGDEMSQYFTNWITTADTENNEEDTEQLYQLANLIDPPNDPETNQPMSRTDFLDRLYKSIKSAPGKLVNIRTLSELFYKDPRYLSDQMDDHNIIINGEFKAHTKTLNKFIQIRAKADQVELSFPHSAYKTIVKFDAKDNSQIIIKSEKLVNKVREMLNKEE